MKDQIIITKNVQSVLLSVGEMQRRLAAGVEGMCLLHGGSGEGKTTATAYAVNKFDGVFVRATITWTVTTMLGDLVEHLGAHRMARRQPMMEFLIAQLRDTQRPVFIDEADYLSRHLEMLDTVRDIYDLTHVPVMLIGMEHLPKKLLTHARLRRRITQEIRFQGLDLDDLSMMTESVCEVPLASDLLALLHHETHGNIGLLKNGLETVERVALANGWTHVDCETWGERPLFFGQHLGRGKRR